MAPTVGRYDFSSKLSLGRTQCSMTDAVSSMNFTWNNNSGRKKQILE